MMPQPKQITEVQAQNKLEKFRKQNKNYLYPSFDTIAGTGKNGAIVHYRAKPDNCRIIRKKDIAKQKLEQIRCLGEMSVNRSQNAEIE